MIHSHMTKAGKTSSSALNYLARCWGALDLIFLSWYLGWRLLQGEVPFAHEIARSTVTARSFGDSFPVYATLVSGVLYFSLLVSGVLLLKLRSAGAIVAYLQAPLRVILYVPSLYLLISPAHYVFGRFPVSIEIASIFLSETVKISTIAAWHRQLSKLG